jgi:hypothetical protein
MTTEQNKSPPLKVEVFNQLEDEFTNDFCLFVDNVEGFDWKFFFWLDKETGEWSDLTTEKSLPGDPYDECDPADVPAFVMSAAEAMRGKTIAKARGQT